MKRKDWFLNLLPLFLVWLTDGFSKLWGDSLTQSLDWGVFHFQSHYSSSVFLGFFSELPPSLRIFSLCTIALFLVLSYGTTQIMWPIKSVKFKVGLSLVSGALMGILTEWIYRGYGSTILTIQIANFKSPEFSLAHLSFWIGLGSIGISLFTDKELFVPNDNKRRKRLWINHDYQLRFIFLLLGSALSITFIGMIFSYTYLRMTISAFIGDNMALTNKLLVPYLLTFFIICLNFCGLLIFWGRKISHRHAGPIYAFDKYVNDLIEGRNRRFALRTNDEFKLLESTGRNIAEHLLENGLIDSDDEIKVLTTHKSNSEDFSLGAIPMEGQNPDYSEKSNNLLHNIKLSINANHVRSDCPLCKKVSSMHFQSSISDHLAECVHCHFIFDPSQHYVTKRKKSAIVSEPEKESYYRQLNNVIVNSDSTIKSNESLARIFSLSLGSTNKEWLYEFNNSPGWQIFSHDGLTTIDANLSPPHCDLMALNNIIEWSQEPHKLLDFCYQQLNTNGLLYIVTPNRESFIARWFPKYWLLATEEPFGIFNFELLAKTLNNHSFEVISHEAHLTKITLEELLTKMSKHSSFWPQLLFTIIPKMVAQKLTIHLPLGQMAIVARKLVKSTSLPMDRASNL